MNTQKGHFGRCSRNARHAETVPLALCGLLALGILHGCGRAIPMMQAVLEPDYSLVSSVEREDLELAAQILTSRSRDTGTYATFRVTDHSQIVASVLGPHPTEFFEGGGTAIGLVEFVDLGNAPIELGTTIATDFEHGYQPEADGIKRHTVLTNREIDSAFATGDTPGEYVVEFTLTPDGKSILADYTTEHINSFLGVVVDKAIISAPRVISPITDGKAAVAGLTKDEAVQLAMLTNTEGPLPIPLALKSFTIPSE